MFRLATEEKEIDEYLEEGDGYLGKVKSSDCRKKIKTDLKALTQRKSKLNTRLLGQQERLVINLFHTIS